MKILLIDDNEEYRQILAMLLELEGFTVVATADGQSGVRLAGEELPDLIITDLDIPELDGIKVIRKVRESPELSSIPVMAITGHGEWNAALAAQAGANCTLTKTAGYYRLLRKLKSLATSKSNPPVV